MDKVTKVDFNELMKYIEFEFPIELKRIIEHDLYNLEPWHILDTDQILKRYQGMKERYPAKELIPFASRQDNDDVACFEKGSGYRIYLIHDYASQGWEQHAVYDDFWQWFRAAIEDMIWFE